MSGLVSWTEAQWRSVSCLTNTEQKPTPGAYSNLHTSNLAWTQVPYIEIASIYAFILFCNLYELVLHEGCGRCMQVDKNGKSEACAQQMRIVLFSVACTRSLSSATIEVDRESLAFQNPKTLSITAHNWASELPMTVMQSPWQYFPIRQSNTMLPRVPYICTFVTLHRKNTDVMSSQPMPTFSRLEIMEAKRCGTYAHACEQDICRHVHGTRNINLFVGTLYH